MKPLPLAIASSALLLIAAPAALCQPLFSVIEQTAEISLSVNGTCNGVSGSPTDGDSFEGLTPLAGALSLSLEPCSTPFCGAGFATSWNDTQISLNGDANAGSPGGGANADGDVTVRLRFSVDAVVGVSFDVGYDLGGQGDWGGSAGGQLRDASGALLPDDRPISLEPGEYTLTFDTTASAYAGLGSVYGWLQMSFTSEPPPPPPINVVDILPGECPNELRTAISPRDALVRRGGSIRVAVTELAGEQLPTDLRLEGVPPLMRQLFGRWYDREDLTGPGDGSCSCEGRAPDGSPDLIVEFPLHDVLAAVGPVSHGQELMLTLTGRYFSPLDGWTDFSSTDCVVLLPPGGKHGFGAETVLETGIESIRPNPFNPRTSINYGLEVGGFIELEVFDLRGRRVERLHSGRQDAGRHSLTWDARAHASGTYFLRLTTASGVEMHKLMLLK